MSRLDYITVAIVAACILAIIFLVYKMTDLFGNEQPVVDPIETDNGQVEQEQEDTTYNYNIEDEDTGGEASTDTDVDSATGEAASTDKTSNPNEDEERTPTTNNPVNPSPKTSTPSQSGGKYMVIAGTFSQEVSSKRQLKKLKSLGYSNATIEPFDKGKYQVVLVDRFDNMSEADRLVKDLKAEGVSSYVKAKVGNN